MINEGSIKKALTTAARTSKSVELRDDGDRGAGRLCLRVRSLRSQVIAEWYALSYRGGRRRQAKIGSYPAVSLAVARKTFREAHAPVISAGGAPTGPLSRASAGPREATVRALVTDYLKQLEGRSSHDNAKNYLAAAIAKLPGGADRLASSVTTDDILEILSGIYNRGAVVCAASTRAYLHAAFQSAIRAENSYAGRGKVRRWGIKSNPVSAIPVDEGAVRTGHRHLPPDEWAKFYRWLERRPEPEAKGVMLCMLAGQRLVEILNLWAAQFDRHEHLLSWDKTKNKLPHTIPVCRRASEILTGMTMQGPLFPDGEAYDVIGRLCEKFLAENPDIMRFIARDLRRTWKTLAGAAGLSKEIRDKLQNHALGDVSSRHYDRWDAMPEKRAAIEVWGQYVDRMLAGGHGGR